VEEATAGAYTVEVQIDWTEGTVRDYNLRVYANSAVQIKNSEGKTNQITAWKNIASTDDFLKGSLVALGALSGFAEASLVLATALFTTSIVL